MNFIKGLASFALAIMVQQTAFSKEQFFRFSQGRMETPEDSCQIIEAQTTLEQSGGKLKTLIESSTRHRLRLLRTKIAD